MGKYGIDGFKFDAGDIAILANGEYDYYDKNADQNIFSQRWAELGLSYPFNEFRAAWKFMNVPVMPPRPESLSCATWNTVFHIADSPNAKISSCSVTNI